MNLNYGRRLSPEELMEQQEAATAAEEPTQTVVISAEDWEGLTETLAQMQALSAEMSREKRQMQTMGERCLTTIQQAAEEQKTALSRALGEQERITAETLRRMEKTYTEQAGRLSAKASEKITKRVLKDDAMWGLRFVLAIFPTLLILALSVYMGWLSLFQR